MNYRVTRYARAELFFVATNIGLNKISWANNVNFNAGNVFVKTENFSVMLGLKNVTIVLHNTQKIKSKNK